jgi:hypothetical protein
MRYLLIMRDVSGRGYKAVHDFETEVERSKYVRKLLKGYHYSGDHLSDALSTLERGAVFYEDDSAMEIEYV